MRHSVLSNGENRRWNRGWRRVGCERYSDSPLKRTSQTKLRLILRMLSTRWGSVSGRSEGKSCRRLKDRSSALQDSGKQRF